MKKIILLSLLSIFSFNIFATHYLYSSDDGHVKLYVTQNMLGNSYVTTLEVANNKCVIKKRAGLIRGHLNTNVSHNFAIFGWHFLENGTVNGVLTNADVKSYAQNYVEWSTLTRLGCNITAGKVFLPHVKQY